MPGRCAPVEHSRAHSAAQTRCRRPGDPARHIRPPDDGISTVGARGCSSCAFCPASGKFDTVATPHEAPDGAGSAHLNSDGVQNHSVDPTLEIARCFLKLANLPSAALDRLRNRDTCRLRGHLPCCGAAVRTLHQAGGSNGGDDVHQPTGYSCTCPQRAPCRRNGGAAARARAGPLDARARHAIIAHRGGGRRGGRQDLCGRRVRRRARARNLRSGRRPLEPRGELPARGASRGRGRRQRQTLCGGRLCARLGAHQRRVRVQSGSRQLAHARPNADAPRCARGGGD